MQERMDGQWRLGNMQIRYEGFDLPVNLTVATIVSCYQYSVPLEIPSETIITRYYHYVASQGELPSALPLTYAEVPHQGRHMPHPEVAHNKLWYLKHINLFSTLTMAELQEINRITRMQEVKKRQPIYLPGDPSTTVYLLKKGRVKIASTDASGKEVTFEILEPGEIFGELEALEDSPRETQAEALDDALICAIRREDFNHYLRRHSDLTVKLTKLIGLRLRKIQSRVEDLVFRDVPARLAHVLLELSKTDGRPDAGGVRIGAKLTHQELANLVGCTRETISNTLGRFREHGLIRIDGRSITILNLYRLSRMIS
jgi:CRP/FNR family transcriptional regulator, cyclic AMP receptor protein